MKKRIFEYRGIIGDVILLLSMALLIGIILAGCGNGSGSSPQPGLAPPAPPPPAVSARIEQSLTQVPWSNYAKVYFINTAQVRNTGEAGLANAYLTIEGEDRYLGWALMAASLPFNLPANTATSVTTEFSYWLNDILLVTGPNNPKNYGVRVTLRDPDGSPLDSNTATVIIP